MQLNDLKKPFPIEKVSFRIGSRMGDKSKGIGLAYIDARDVMERLDEVCGPENWQALYPHANGKTSCKIGIRVWRYKEDGSFEDEAWVWKENGAGDTDIEGDKGAFSDAFKRAAVLWGIGRYLYDMPNTWVPLENEGKKFSASGLETLKNALAKLSGGVIEADQKEAWKTQKRLVNEIHELKDEGAAIAWHEKNADAIEHLPLEESEQVSTEYERWIEGLKNGDTMPVIRIKMNAQEAEEWLNKAEFDMGKLDTEAELKAWYDENEGRIMDLSESRKGVLRSMYAMRKKSILDAKKLLTTAG